MKTKRNAGIELYRIALMYGICAFHAVVTCGHNVLWINNLLSTCVVGFAFITGYFGMSFSWGKVLRLGATAIWSATLVVGVRVLMEGDVTNVFTEIWKMSTGFWFLNAYIVMMCFASLLSGFDFSIRKIAPALVLIFGVGWLSHSYAGAFWVPRLPGFEAFSGVTLFGIYLVGRAVRLSGIESRMSVKWGLAIFGACGVLIAVFKLGVYNSPFAVMFAAVSFLLAKRCKFGGGVAKVVLLISPSMFAVYLLHANSFGILLMRRFENALLEEGLSLGLAFFAVASVTFVVALVADLPRRIFARFIMQHGYDKFNR